MKVSQRIIQYGNSLESLSEEIGKFNDSFYEVQRNLNPLPDNIDSLETMSEGRFPDRIAAWRRLEDVWNSCEGDLRAKYEAVYQEISRGGIPDFIKPIIDKKFAIVFDEENCRRLYERAIELEEKAQNLETCGKKLGRELTDYVHGGMVFDVKSCISRHDTHIYELNPVRRMSTSVTISYFPRQDMKSVALRFLSAASKTRWDRFQLLGTMDDDYLIDVREALGKIEGKTTEGEQIMRGVDLRNVRSLWLVFTDTSKPEDRIYYSHCTRIDLDRSNRNKKIVRTTNNLLLKVPTRDHDQVFYISDKAEIIDNVSESYRT